MSAKLSSFDRVVREYKVKPKKMEGVVIFGIHDPRVNETSHTQHRTVGQVGQDTRRPLGDCAHAAVHQLATSTNATGSDAQGQGQLKLGR